MDNYNKKIIKYYKSGETKYEQYYMDDKLHRIDGPAEISYGESGDKRYEEYYIDDEDYSKQDYDKKIKGSCDQEEVMINGVKYKLTRVLTRV